MSSHANLKFLPPEPGDIASNVDQLASQLAMVDNRVLEIAFNEGKRTLECFRKEAAWNTLSKEEKIKEFDKHLNNLQTRCLPGVEVIQPKRVGSYPFLKVTFVSTGEKRDFFLKNKCNVNKYNGSTLVPSLATKGLGFRIKM